MVGSLFLPEEVDSERTVILSEREGLENDPMFKLDDAVKRAAFDVHPYRNEIIGETADLNAMGRDDLYRYYRNHYTPNNAVLTIAGNFDADETLEKIRARFGPILPWYPHPTSLPSMTNLRSGRPPLSCPLRQPQIGRAHV